MKVPVVENVLKLNDEVAAINRETIAAAGVYAVNLIGGPGCGKTTLLESTLRHLSGEMQIGVLVGDLTTSRDGERLARFTDNVVQINTGRGCHLDANQVRQGLARLPLDELDLLIIENVGNMICPVGFDLGEHEIVGMFSVSEGDDKAAKHPYLVTVASLILLNKTDLLPHVPFDAPRFRNDIQRLNPQVEVMEIAALSQSPEPWLTRLRRSVAEQNCAISSEVVRAAP